MRESRENALQICFREKPAIEAAVVLLAAATTALTATEPLIAVYLLPAALLVIALANFDWFVYTTVFLLPWYPLPNIDLPVRDAFLFLRLVLFAGVWIIRKRSGRSISEWLVGSAINKLVMAYAAVAAISLLVSPLPVKLDASRSLVRLFSYLAMFYAISGWIERREQVFRLIKLLLWSTVCVTLFGFYQAAIGGYTAFYSYLFNTAPPEWNGRVPSFLFQFNALAAYLNLIIPFAIGSMLLTRHRSTQRLGWLCLCTGTAAVYLTGSRGGLLALGGILLLSAWFVRMRFRPNFDKLLRGLLAVALAGAIVILVVPKGPEQEQTTRVREVDDFTELSRLALWGTAAAMFMEHPVLGVGYGNYRALYGDYLTDVDVDQLDAHSLYLQLLAETGVFGFALFMALMALLLRQAAGLLRTDDPFYRLVGLGLGGGLVGFLIHGFVDYFFHVQPQLGGLFWLICAVGLVVSEDTNQSQGFASLSQA